MDVEQGEAASTGTTTDTAVTVTNASGSFELSFFVKCITGTLKIGKGSVNASAHAFGPTDVIPPIGCKNGELHVQQGSAGDTWVVTVCQ